MPGQVTRKDGRIVELPGRVVTIYWWLFGVSLLTPVIMLLTGLASPRSVLPWWGGLIIAILPLSLVFTAMVAMLREGLRGNAMYAFALTGLNYIAMTLQPYLEYPLTEMLVTRTLPILGILATMYYFRLELHYNLRSLWYSMQAMQDLQRQMANMKAKRDAKKRGEDFDPDKVMDAEAIVRAVEERTGREIPAHMQGITVKPGFRQDAKDNNRRSSTAAKQRKKR